MIFIIYLYTKVVPQWLPLVKGRGKKEGCLEGDNMVWGMVVVHHGMKNACGGDAIMLGAHQSLRSTAFFWIALSQNIGHIFCTRFCLAAYDN